MKKTTLSLFLALFQCSSVLTMNLPDEELTKLADDIVWDLSTPEEQCEIKTNKLQTQTKQIAHKTFISAVIKNNSDAVKELLKESLFQQGLNTRCGYDEQLPLEIALKQHQGYEIASLLLEAGANPNAINSKFAQPFKDVIGKLPIPTRSARMKTRLIKKLTEAQANIFASYEVKLWYESPLRELSCVVDYIVTPLNHAKKLINWNGNYYNGQDIVNYCKNVKKDFYDFLETPVSFLAETKTLSDRPMPNEIFLALMYRNPEFHKQLNGLYIKFARNNKLNQAAHLLKKVNFTDKELNTYNALGLPTTKEALVNKYGHIHQAHIKTTDINFKFR